MQSKQFGISWVAIAVVFAAVPGVSLAVDNVQARYAGAASGGWSGNGSFVPGPPDDHCANMGAVGKQNLAYSFGFNVPGGATITGVEAQIKASAKGGQNVGLQLVNDSGVLIGSQRTWLASVAGAGNCALSQVSGVDGGLGGWGLNPGDLTPTIVNSSNFGIEFTKLEKSEVKVDAVCIELFYTTAAGPAVQESCFQAPVLNSINVVKEVVGAVPASDWSFTFEGQPGFTLPAAGGAKPFVNLANDTYTITETNDQGYGRSVSCSNGASGGNSVDVTVSGGAVVTCTFTNTAPTPPASITVKKVLAPGSASPSEDWYFSFEADEFFLGDGGTKTYAGLAAGTYNVSEIDTLGYSPSVSCDNGQSGGSSVNVTVASGADVLCTFTNTQRPTAQPIPAVGALGLGALALMLAGLARRRMR